MAKFLGRAQELQVVWLRVKPSTGYFASGDLIIPVPDQLGVSQSKGPSIHLANM